MSETENENTRKDEIVAIYLELAEEKFRLPTYADFLDRNITREAIRHNFGNLTKLHDLVEDERGDELSQFIAHESMVFSRKKLGDLQELLGVGKYQRYVITTAVNGKKIDSKFYSSIQSYCEKNDALLLILPSADIASTSTVMKKWVFDPVLKDEFFIFEDVQLNSKLFLSNIKISAKHINPTTGLSRIGQRNGSYIFASPKQFLEFVATSPSKEKHPMALMTPGAITVPDYSNERYLSDRTSYIAESDHVIGAIIVEVENDKEFHFRQIQSNSKGQFVDLGQRYFPDGRVERIDVHLIMGDYHVGWTDPLVKEATAQICSDLEVRDIFVHDFFDGNSINHHNKHKFLKKIKNFTEFKSNLQSEIQDCCYELNWLLSNVSGSVVHIRGNHDDRLSNWLDTAEYAHDIENHYYALDLAKAYLEGNDPLKFAIENEEIVENPERILWIERDEEFMIGEVEVGQHGDKGPSGTKGSLQSIEKAYGNCVVGHTHSAAILRGAYRVGTSTVFKMDYNVGPSAWTQTHCLIADDGSRQLINIINGKYRI